MDDGLLFSGAEPSAELYLALFDERAYRCNDRVDLCLRFDAGRPVLQGDALDGGAARDPKQLQGAVDAGGDGFGRVGPAVTASVELGRR